jgi:hypothetical protein
MKSCSRDDAEERASRPAVRTLSAHVRRSNDQRGRECAAARAPASAKHERAAGASRTRDGARGWNVPPISMPVATTTSSAAPGWERDSASAAEVPPRRTGARLIPSSPARPRTRRTCTHDNRDAGPCPAQQRIRRRPLALLLKHEDQGGGTCDLAMIAIRAGREAAGVVFARRSVAHLIRARCERHDGGGGGWVQA